MTSSQIEGDLHEIAFPRRCLRSLARYRLRPPRLRRRRRRTDGCPGSACRHSKRGTACERAASVARTEDRRARVTACRSGAQSEPTALRPSSLAPIRLLSFRPLAAVSDLPAAAAGFTGAGSPGRSISDACAGQAISICGRPRTVRPQIQFRKIINRLNVAIEVPTKAAEIGSITAKPAKAIATYPHNSQRGVLPRVST
jgi:hypothetical protein